MGFLSARVFSLVFALGYAYTVAWNVPLFRYYPAVERFSWVDLADKSLGPAMSWFGWMAWPFLVAIVLAAIVPRKLADKIPGWAFPVAVIAIAAAGWHREGEWFLK